MSDVPKPDLIWNRACGSEESSLLAGDLALAAMLVFHGVAMNGGVLHAVGYFDPEDLAEAAAGYRFFGLHDVANLLDKAKVMSETDNDPALLEAELDKRYAASIPSDLALFDRFETYLRRNPSDFAPC